ncbi:MAG: Wzz/FepE/Etk N-terminal domain-containing protein, partial [bacterium]
MPVRSDEELLLARYTRLLWRARWFIVVFCIVAMGLTAVVLLYFVPEIFEASAQLFVKPKHIESPLEIEGLSPKAYQDMLMSDAIIARVRQTYSEQTGQTLPPLEKLKHRFNTEARELQDTTIKKVTSPLINLAVRGVSREEARQLMDLWTRFFIEDYGSVFSRAAYQRFQGQEERAAEIDQELTSKEAELVQLR